MHRITTTVACILLIAATTVAQIFRIDERSFPTIRVWYIPHNNQESIPPQQVRDNGISAALIEHSCTTISPRSTGRLTLCVDVSSSMAVNTASRAMLDTIAAELSNTLGNLERYNVVWFANTAQSRSDLDATTLRNTLGRLSFGGGTNYAAAFEEAARLPHMSGRDRWLLFITDGLDTIKPAAMSALFGSAPPRVVVIMLRNEAPECLRELARITDGGWMELITSPNAAANAARQIARIISGRAPLCSVQYNANATCEPNHDVQLQFPLTTYGIRYRAPQTASLEISTSHIYFGVPLLGSVRDAEITITARGLPIYLDSVWMSGSPNFSAATPTRTLLLPDKPAALTVRYRARDTSAAWGELHLKTSCGQRVVTFSVGRRDAPALRSRLRVISPIGKQLFFSDADVQIEWIGIPPDDTCRIRMLPAGQTDLLTDEATGGRYRWKVPPLDRPLEVRFRIEPIASHHQAISDPIHLLPTRGILRATDLGQAPIGMRKDTVLHAFITNTSATLPLVVERIEFSGDAASDFGIAQGVFPAVISPGETLDVELYFRPTARGKRSAEILLVSPSGYVRELIWGHGIGIAPQHFIVDYGTVGIGSERSEQIDLGHHIAGIIRWRGDTTVFTMAEHSEHSQLLVLRFRPDSVRLYRSQLTIHDSLSTATIELIGRGVEPPSPTLASDPTRFRTLLQPTAELLETGTVGVGTFDGVGLLGIYAPIPSLAIFGGGLLPVHVGGQRSSAYALGTRYVHLLSERVGIAIGAIGARSIGERSSDTTTITLAAPFVCATLRFGNARLTAGYGYAFKEHLSTSQRFRADTPVFSLGGDYQFAEQWKLAADIFHLSTVESLPIAVAARYFGERFSLEGGIVVGVPTASSERFFAVPLLSAFWMFR